MQSDPSNISHRYLYIQFTQSHSIGAFRLDGPGDAVLVQNVSYDAEVSALNYTLEDFQLAGMSLYLP